MMEQKTLTINNPQRAREEYRKIVIPFNVDEKILFILSRFFSYFPREDIFFETRNGRLIIFIRQLDFSYFLYKIRQFSRVYSMSEINILQQIANRIKEINIYSFFSF